MSGGVPVGGYQRAATAEGQQVRNAQAGLWWPAAEPARLRAAAAAWRRLAADAGQVRTATSAAVLQVGGENHGQGINAFETYWSSRWVGGSGCLPAVIEAADSLALALDSYADAVQKAQDRIKELIAAVATAAVIGIGLTVLTVGISDVAAGALAASLVAAAAVIGVELSAEAAAIIATGLVVAGFGALEGGLSDLAIQGERVGYFQDQASIDWQEVLRYSALGAATAGVTFGVGTSAEAAAPALGRIGTRLLGREATGGSSEALLLLSRGAVRSNAEAVSHPGGISRTAATVEDVATRAGIPLQNTSVRIIRDDEVDYIRYLDAQRATALTPVELGGSEIHLGPAAFTDEEMLARVLGHEWTHVLQLRAGAEVNTASLVDLEAQAYGSEEAYVNNLRSSGG